MTTAEDPCALEIEYNGKPVSIKYKGDRICVVGTEDGSQPDDGIKDPQGAALSDILHILQTQSMERLEVSIRDEIDLDVIMPLLKSSKVKRLRISQIDDD